MMKHKACNIGELIQLSENGSLLLPNFQREFVWDRKNNQRELLTSIIYRMPIGSLLIVNGQKGYFATKKICLLASEAKDYQGDFEDKQEIQYLLDGQQRLSTIKSIMYDLFLPDPSANNYSDVYELLKTRWFVRVVPAGLGIEENIDLFGYGKMSFQGQKVIDKYEPTVIKETIEYKKVFPKGKNWWDIEYRKEDWTKANNEGFNYSTRKDIVAVEAARNGLVPLYDIYTSDEVSPSEKLHYKVLSKIADQRIDELKAEIEDEVIDPYEIFNVNMDSEADIDEKLNDKKNDWVMNVFSYLEDLKKVDIPIIQLEAKEMTRVIYAFEYVNRGGMNLSVYDLVVAKAAHEMGQITLTDRIIKLIEGSVIELPEGILTSFLGVNIKIWNAFNIGLIKEGQIIDKFKNQYLNLISIVSNIGSNDGAANIDKLKVEMIKKSHHLDLTTEQINENTEKTIIALIRAYTFLQFRCGIVKPDDLKYQLMVLPIAYAFENDNIWSSTEALNKIEYWYWSSLFSGTYRDRQNDQCVRDIAQLNSWLHGGDNPFDNREKKIFQAEGYSDLNTLLLKALEGLNEVPSAIQEGLFQYVLSKQPNDFLNEGIRLKSWELAIGKDYKVDDKTHELIIQKHHIIPLGSSKDTVSEGTKKIRNDKKHLLNSPLNITLISSIANRSIRDKSLRDYISSLNELSTHDHLIPDIDFDIENINDNNYVQFLEKRFRKINVDLKSRLDKLVD